MRGERGAPTLRASLVAGAGIGFLGVALFGLVHALAIVPIWTRLSGGIPFGVAAGIAMGWALFELRAAGRCDRGARAGLLFGILLWSTLLPMTALTVWLREAGLHSSQHHWELPVELLLVALTAVSGAGSSRTEGGRSSHWRLPAWLWRWPRQGPYRSRTASAPPVCSEDWRWFIRRAAWRWFTRSLSFTGTAGSAGRRGADPNLRQKPNGRAILTAKSTVMVFTAPLAGKLSDRLGPRPLSLASMTCFLVSLFCQSRLTGQSSVIWLAVLMILSGIAVGLFVSPNNSAMLGAAPQSAQGVASAVLGL